MSSFKINKDDMQLQVTITDQSAAMLGLGQILKRLRAFAKEMIAEWVKFQQRQALRQLIGAPWQPIEPAERKLGCPECGSVAVGRKAWRKRTLKVACFGKVNVPRRQCACRDCGHAWMPFEQALALPNGQHGRRLLKEAIGRVLDSSYQKAADADSRGPSASKLHRLVKKCVPEQTPGEAQTVVVDATDVPGWRSGSQISLSVAHQIGPERGQTAPNGRPAPRDRRLIATSAGAETDIKPRLAEYDIQALVHDGNMRMEGIADYVGRCRWHIPYTVSYLLYKDDIIGQDNKDRVSELRAIISQNSSEKTRRWLEANSDAQAACSHVQRSLPGLKTMDQQSHAFSVQTTSHLEREMVEINKRFENGGGWTCQGAESLLWLHQLRRHEPKRYQKYLRNKIEQMVYLN